MSRECIFRSESVRAAEAELAAEHHKPPFGDFRRSWKREHCEYVDPYGGACPYAIEECVAAYAQVAHSAMMAKRPGAYFKVAAKHLALRRADQKRPRNADHATQSHRARLDDGLDARPGRHGGRQPTGRLPAGTGLRRGLPRPLRASDVFGAPDAGPREGPAEDGSAGAV